MPENYQKKFERIPAHVRDQLLSDDAVQANDILLTKYNLNAERADEFMAVLRDVVLMEESVEDLPELLKDRLRLEEPIARQLAVDTVGFRLLPIQDWLGNVRQFIPSWGGKSDRFVDRLEKMYSLRFFRRDLFDPMYSEHELGELTVQEFERLDNIIFSYVVGKRSEQELQELLEREAAQGGMGFDEGKAAGFVEDLKALVEAGELNPQLVEAWRKKRDAVLEARQIPGAVEAMKKDFAVPETVKGAERRANGEPIEVLPLGEESPYMPEYEAHVKSLEESVGQPSEALRVPQTPTDFDLESDEAEVTAAAGQGPQLEKTMGDQEILSWLGGVAQGLGIQMDDEGMKRWQDTGMAFLRDVRDAFETKDVLTRPMEESGLALPEETADAALAMLEQGKAARNEGNPLPPLGVAPAAPDLTPEAATPQPAQEPASAPEPDLELESTPAPNLAQPAQEPVLMPMPEPEQRTPVATPSHKLHRYFSTNVPTATTLANTATEAPTAIAPEVAAPALEVAAEPQPLPEEAAPEQVSAPEPTPVPEAPAPALEPAPEPKEQTHAVIPAAEEKPGTETPKEAPIPPKHPALLGIPGESPEPPIAPGAPTAPKPQSAPATPPRPTMEYADEARTREESAVKARKELERKPEQEHGPMTKRIIRPPEPAPGKLPMVEVKPPETRVMGPLEELASTSITMFRDLAASPEEATSIIHEKIMLFQEQGIGRLLEAKEAWKKSPLNQLLLEIGFESAEGGKTVDQVLEARLNAKQPTLSMEEFNALTDLNIQLNG